jgi:large subunit ribosomal protein L25
MKVEKRTEKASLLKKKGIVPGVLYGEGIEPVKVKIPLLNFTKLVRDYGTSKTFSITLDGEKHIVYIKTYEINVLDYSQYSHFDLLKVTSDTMLTSNVSLHFIGREIYNKSMLVFTSNLDEVELEYQVGSGISHLDVDVSDLKENEPLHVSDLVVPKGTKILNDPNQIVCGLSQVKLEVEATEDEEEGFLAEAVDELVNE